MYEINYDEGLGTVYERFILNDIFEKLLERYTIRSVLEAPIYGMTGITGINSVYFAVKGCYVTLVDVDENHLKSAYDVWKKLGLEKNLNIIHQKNLYELPFENNSFDLVWNFAALQYVENSPLLIKELIRVSKSLIFISVQNKMQIGYVLRKYLLQRDFFKTIHEEWIDINWLKRVFEKNNLKIIEDGIFDIPPWPDTCMPIKKIIKNEKTSRKWNWNIVDYYMGKDKTLKDRIERYKFIENSKIPERIKAVWAHHRYVICKK